MKMHDCPYHGLEECISREDKHAYTNPNPPSNKEWTEGAPWCEECGFPLSEHWLPDETGEFFRWIGCTDVLRLWNAFATIDKKRLSETLGKITK